MSVLHPHQDLNLSFDLFYIAMSDRCNLSCVMCSTTKHPAEYDKEMKKIELTLEQWRQIIANITRFKIKTISFGGGEPLLRGSDLNQLVKMVASRNIGVNIVTNSTLLTDDFLEGIREYKEQIGFVISLDGLKKENDSIRGKGVFKKVMQATDILKKGNWRFLFTAVLMPLNLLHFRKYLEFLHKEFPEAMVDIQPVIPHNEIYFIREKFVLPDTHLLALKEILDYLHQEAQPQTSELIFRKEHLRGIVIDADPLWKDLENNGYIHADGTILDKFRHLSNAAEMKVSAQFNAARDGVFLIIRDILESRKKLKITRTFKVLDLYWEYFNNTLHTNNQCKMGVRSFNINRSGNIWICGRELEYPLYQYKLEEIFTTPEYLDAMKRVENCTSPCFAGLVV